MSPIGQPRLGSEVGLTTTIIASERDFLDVEADLELAQALGMMQGTTLGSGDLSANQALSLRL